VFEGVDLIKDSGFGEMSTFEFFFAFLKLFYDHAHCPKYSLNDKIYSNQ
jgi:hypothetical protein